MNVMIEFCVPHMTHYGARSGKGDDEGVFLSIKAPEKRITWKATSQAKVFAFH